MAPHAKVKPLDAVEVIGKRGTNEPFSIRLQRGQYLYIEIEQLEQLKQINEAYRSIYKASVKPLEPIKIVGRGGVAGYRPFLLNEHTGRYLCIEGDGLHQLMEINTAYKKLIEGERKREPKEKRGGEGLRQKKKEIKRRIEDPQQQAEEAIKGVRNGRYVYGIVPALEGRKSFGNIGIEGDTEVYTIDYKNVAAVVSDVPVDEYTPTEEHSRTHEAAARAVLEESSVAPAAFGQVFKNEKILRSVMRRAYKTLNETLRLVDNKIELGVKAILPKELVESLDEKKRNELKKNSSEIFNTLNTKADQSTKGRLFSDRLVLNSSFLVDRDRMDEFSDEVGRLGKKFKDLKLKYSGPWPPYSFVYIKIGAKGIEVGKREVR